MENAEKVYHFTSMRSFEAIVRSKSIRLNDVTRSNDPAETVFALDALEHARMSIIVNDPTNDQRIRKLSCAIYEFVEEYRAQSNVMVISFCAPQLPLALWRSYGDNGRGVALGFSCERLVSVAEQKGLKFKKVEYWTQKDMEKAADELVKECLNLTENEIEKKLKGFYIDGLYRKRKENEFEVEYRLVYVNNELKKLSLSSLLNSYDGIPSEVDGMASVDDFKLFYALPLVDNQNRCIINDVCLGPNCKAPESAVQYFLAKHDLYVYGVSKDYSVVMR